MQFQYTTDRDGTNLWPPPQGALFITEKEMVTTQEHRRGFVSRLIAACNESLLIPPHGQGRQRMIAERTGVAQETVSKWFKGLAMPRPEPMGKLCDLLEVEQSWLALGVRPAMEPEERKVHAREAEGAVHLVWGYVSLSGGHCGAPGPNDSRRGYVDFYATLSGSVMPIHVSLGRELSRGQFEFIVPKEFAEVRCIGVAANGTRFDFLDLTSTVIEEHRHKKAGSWQLLVNRIENRYITGADEIRRIKSFGEFR